MDLSPQWAESADEHASREITWVSQNVYGGMGAALGILLMVGIVLLACESFTSYVVLGSYGAAFHRLDVLRRRILDEATKPSTLVPQSQGRNLAIIEMFAYAGTFLSAFVIIAAAGRLAVSGNIEVRCRELPGSLARRPAGGS